MNIQEAMNSGHELDIYVDSEMADEKTGEFDDLWQSIYDLVQVATFGIVEEEESELEKAIDWLKKTQALTTKYKELEINF